MISWKNTLERINEELRQTNAKKQALDELYNSGKISQATYENFNRELTETLNEIQTRRENLVRKISQEALRLEQKIGELETFLVNCEILHASGEMEDSLYQSEIKLWTTGLETIRGELNNIRETINTLQTGTPTIAVTEATQTPILSEPAKEIVEVKNEEVTLVENIENISTTVSTNEENKTERISEEVKVEEQPQMAETANPFRQEENSTQETAKEAN